MKKNTKETLKDFSWNLDTIKKAWKAAVAIHEALPKDHGPHGYKCTLPESIDSYWSKREKEEYRYQTGKGFKPYIDPMQMSLHDDVMNNWWKAFVVEYIDNLPIIDRKVSDAVWYGSQDISVKEVLQVVGTSYRTFYRRYNEGIKKTLEYLVNREKKEVAA